MFCIYLGKVIYGNKNIAFISFHVFNVAARKF